MTARLTIFMRHVQRVNYIIGINNVSINGMIKGDIKLCDLKWFCFRNPDNVNATRFNQWRVVGRGYTCYFDHGKRFEKPVGKQSAVQEMTHLSLLLNICCVYKTVSLF